MKTERSVLTLLFSIFVLFVISGCSEEKDFAAQKKECLDQKKDFLVKKVLNYRTGEYLLKGECKDKA